MRKQLKDEARAQRATAKGSKVSIAKNGGDQEEEEKKKKKKNEKWELTVGIEIHARLNTARKLFSGTCFSMS